MHDQIHKQILDAFFVVLRPIAKILLRYGIGYREFAEVAKSAFVDVATSEYGLRGRPTNASRVAVMTGLTRKEVRRLRESLERGDTMSAQKYNRLSVVLETWHSDKDFLDDNGAPAILPFAGDGATFTSLVKKVGGDIPPGAVRSELKRLSAVEETNTGQLRLLDRTYFPTDDHENLCLALVQSVYALLSSIAHNTDVKRSEGLWAQWTASSSEISSKDLPRLRRVCTERAKEAVESYDDILIAHSRRDSAATGDKIGAPVVIGVFYFEERDDEMAKLWRDS
jgi:hypothetical protein